MYLKFHTKEMKTGGFLGLVSQSSLNSKPQVRESFCLRKARWTHLRGRHLRLTSDLHMQSTYTHAHT